MAEKKKARREYGEGSIYQRKSDGRYVGSFYVDGERKYVYGDTRKEAKQKLEVAQRQAQAGTLVASNKQTVAEYMMYWLPARLNIEASTRASYQSCIDAHIIPALGKLQLQKLTAMHIQRFVVAMDEDFEASTTRLSYIVLLEAMKDAVKWKLIGINPCQDISLPKLSSHEMHVLDFDQTQAFLVALRGHQYEVLFALAVTTGMRKGELLGLHWSDIDLEHSFLQIKRTLVYINNVGFQETDPKTATSRRRITLTQFAVDLLREHRAKQLAQRLKAKSWPHPEQVFTTGLGTYIHSARLHLVLGLLLKQAGLPAIRFHDLRHTCATLLLILGTHPKVVQELLGHSSIKITMDLYSHVLPNMQGDTMRGFNTFLTAQSAKKEAF